MQDESAFVNTYGEISGLVVARSASARLMGHADQPRTSAALGERGTTDATKVTPWPYNIGHFPFSANTYHVAQMTLKHDTELAQHLHQAKAVPLTWELQH
ncbi:MAG: hypothetical protein HYV26_09285 [Candidatus Hydrogenedentes bacterium]|nr:hypothetical protein [Candidatus Hydrogenedentota bacterium]